MAEGNVGSDTLSNWAEKRVLFKTNLQNTNAALAVTTENNITVSNPEQASGGESGESAASIRINAVNNVNSQMRAVTLQDYQARVMAMPQQFGTVFRSYTIKNNSGYGACIYTICRNASLNLVNTSGVVTNNIKTYLDRFKSFSDTIEIKSGKIANIGVDFSLVVDPSANAPEVLMKTIMELKKKFSINRSNFNDNISTSEIMAVIQAIEGVNAIETFKIINKTSADNEGDRNYSGFNFDINANTFSGIVSFPQDVVWEMKYPNFDIVARYTGGTSAPGSGGGTGGGY